MTSEPLPEAIHVGHLTEALRRSGVLGEGCVSDVAVESSRMTVLSQIIRLRLTYDGSAPGAPQSFILKTGRPDRGAAGWNGARHEVAFYMQVASVMPTHAIPRCFEAHCNEAAKTWHLLLEDLTETHVVADDWPLPPAMQACESIVDAHARRQSTCWDDPRLDTLIGAWPWRDTAATDQYLAHLAAQITRFTDRLGDRLPRERRDLYARLLDAAPCLGARYRTRRNLTIVQGDAHVWNCFLPRGGGDDVRFFDWDSWRIDVGASDLAYMMAVHWYPDRRRRAERSLLDRYHVTLVAQGVRGYDRGALDDDYRLSTLWQLTWPVWQEAFDIPPVIWWNNLERVLLAVDDLGCCELL